MSKQTFESYALILCYWSRLLLPVDFEYRLWL